MPHEWKSGWVGRVSGEKSKPLSIVQVSVQWKSCCLMLPAVAIRAECAKHGSVFTLEASFLIPGGFGKMLLVSQRSKTRAADKGGRVTAGEQ